MLYLSEEMCESDHKNNANIIVNHSNSSPNNHRTSDNFNHNSNTSSSSSSSHSDSSSGKNERHVKKEQKRRPKPKDGTKLICRVCNDVALGYNFDAITCESCKAFFRRNALKKKVFNCTFEGKCRLDPHTRKFCASCRLKRCFEIGMKKGWILNEEQLAKRRQRLSQANEKKLKSSQSSALSPSGSYSNQSNHSSTSSTSTTSVGIFSDTEKEMTVSSQPIVENEYKQITMPVDKYPILSDIYWNLLNSKKDVRYTLYPIRQLVQHHEDIFSGNCKIEENIEPNIPYDSIECMYKSITLVISFMKTIPDFQKLAHEDRIAIFMGSIREVFAIRAAISYSFKGGFVVFRNQKGQDKYLDPVILKNALGEKLFTQIADFIKSFKICTNEDKVIMILLMLIEFFNPEKSEVANVLLVKKAQEKFTYWLRCYIEAKYPEMIAKLLYQKVLLKLNDVREIGNICNEASKTFLWKDFDPLIAEILDLK